MNTTYTIGEFVEVIKQKYPAITPSKVRFLESEGLLKPQRTQGGYRVYTHNEVERVLLILEMQQQYLPLKVIKARLKNRSNASPHKRQNASSKPQTVSFEELADDELHSVTQAQKMLQVPISFMQELASCGFIKLREDARGEARIDGRDFSCILHCYELHKHGIEPRNVRFLVTGAGHQISLLEQVLTSKSTSEQTHTANLIATHMQKIQAELVKHKFKERNKEK